MPAWVATRGSSPAVFVTPPTRHGTGSTSPRRRQCSARRSRWRRRRRRLSAAVGSGWRGATSQVPTRMPSGLSRRERVPMPWSCGPGRPQPARHGRCDPDRACGRGPGDGPAKKASCLLAVAFAHRGVGDLRAADRVLEDPRAPGQLRERHLCVVRSTEDAPRTTARGPRRPGTAARGRLRRTALVLGRAHAGDDGTRVGDGRSGQRRALCPGPALPRTGATR